MSDLKFFFNFNVKPINSFCHITSLKQGCIFSSFILIFTEVVLFIMDLFNSKDTFGFLIFRHFIFSFLNFYSFVKFVKSLYQFDYSQAYFGYMAIAWSVILHGLLFIISIINGTHLSSIYLSYLNLSIQNYPENFLIYSIPNLLFILVEAGISFICFSYAKHLSQGKDALVDGQSFDKYFVDLGSDNSRVMSENSITPEKKHQNHERKTSENNIFQIGLNFLTGGKYGNTDNGVFSSNEMPDKASIHSDNASSLNKSHTNSFNFRDSGSEI